tara:strand:+ start:102 stop:323 length:222 start_codon:yes stop_codon:yes gene_type:complete
LKIEIYSKDNCVFCEKAVSLATLKGLDITVKKLGVDFEMGDLMEVFPTARTFPQIILNDEKIGGYTELSQIIK